MLGCRLCWRRSFAALISVHRGPGNSSSRRPYYDPGFAALTPERRKPLAYHDSHKLADAVKRHLSKGDALKALQLVHESSRRLDSVVGWNHIIRHYLDQGSVQKAFRIYNDVLYYPLRKEPPSPPSES